MKIYLNGKLVPKDEAKVSVFDHGLLYGDGVFEGIRAYNGRVFRLREHLDRLINSAKAIKLELPLDKKGLEQAVIDTLSANSLKDAYIRLVVTRGYGDLGLDPRKCPEPTIFIIADKITLYPDEFYTRGLELITVATKRTNPESLNPCIKSLNYLNNILAKIEAVRAGFHEAIMLNSQGYVAECTGDNIFVLKDNKLVTPPSWAGALEGITRGAVIELAKDKLKLQVSEDIFTLYNVYTADECFLTGTAAEVIPVVKVDGRAIGDGKAGKVTTRLIKEFRELTSLTGVPIYEK
ncbi:MAG TPA: branched-chain amino acid aminotransferase [Elusimicrobia bacterium]|nr:MAG: branched-chain-amino-acid transaminase [Elusimicrobia bacterium RIFOXYA12_FULL_49_49]OGS06385.1 MAG: branched-chain-amino-acid transaminase [Elusimicrobia bacterium RIFOXYA1_FULL_47_7]OGS15906.1 MAG: branched-chain-amino-acid transaminase [Elusimicrobia bacterium RIFOXYA2_FULL_47_53]OGS26412.1 MAG: branched-chain-amino-acid transaminase [Elusimicrobia bacterium RIFOXYB12_FULL_50_12]OGS29074.1 MAG: branched-chain-amino-acid transaminase [Elusimicrobia bacterium RIFOXYB2_FULL_46_23]HBU69